MKRNLIALLVLAVLGGIVWWNTQPTSTVSKELSEGFNRFKKADLSAVEKIVITKGAKEPQTVELKKSGDGWVLPKTWDYPAEKKKVEDLVAELKKVTEGENRSNTADNHATFKVDAEKGVHVSLQDKTGTELTKVVIGGDVQSRTLSSGSFVRFGDESAVWAVEASLRGKVVSYPEKIEAKNFLEKVFFKLPEGKEAFRTKLIRSDHTVIVEKRTVEVPVETKDEDKKDDGTGAIVDTGAPKDDAKKDEPKKPESKKEDEFWVTAGTTAFKVDKSKEWDAKNLFTRDLRIEDAAEKKDLKEYGLDNPQLKVELTYRPKDSPQGPEEVTTILFGNAIKEEKDGPEKGEAKAYYVAIQGDPAGRIYTAAKWDYSSWNKEVKDFEKAPEPKPADEKKADDDKKAGEIPITPPIPGVTPVPPAPPPAVTPVPVPPAPPAGTPPPSTAAKPEKVSVRHILYAYKGAARAPETVTRSKEEAKKAAEASLSKLKADPSTFDAVARAESDSAKSIGGNLGEINVGAMDKPFEDAAFSLPIDGISDVVETDQGFHVIQRTK